MHQLTSALGAYQGALLIVSHDLAFLESAGITCWLLLADHLHETTADHIRDLLEAPPAG